MKILFLLPALVSLMPTALAQSILPTATLSDNTEEQDNATGEFMTPWFIDLSNLPKEERTAYVEAFDAAKEAYRKGCLVECESWLNTCELIYDKNPNIWNLRASVLVAQKQFDEAEQYLKKVLEALPDNSVAHLNFSLLFLGRGEYERCIQETDSLIQELQRERKMRNLKQSLIFRKFLCLLMLDREDSARMLVGKVTPLEDSPLYYYSQAALFLFHHDSRTAQRELTTGNTIYSSDPYLYSYKQSLKFSGLEEKAHITVEEPPTPESASPSIAP